MRVRLVYLGLVASLGGACGDSGGGSAATSETGGGDTTGAPTTGAADDTSGAGESTTDAGSGSATAAVTTGETGVATTSDDTTDGVVDIVVALAGIDGLTWEEKPSEVPGYRYFLLYYQQPADHDDPDGLQFTQHMTLLHRDAGAPVVISTDGYYIFPWYQGVAEPTALLDANQLIVEHRFFADSRPEPADWGLLTIEQSAADHHRITTALKDAIYHGPWVSTGVSKGGMTATYFRQFYPDDVVATVAYVAPLSYGTTDTRYWPYLDGIDAACTQALIDFRREVLLRRPEMVMRVVDEAMQDGYTYDIIDEDHAVEVMALNSSWGFWQYGSADACPNVPTAAASDDEVWAFLNDVSPPHDLSDARVLALEPYYWQAAVQLGAPATDEVALADLLLYPGFDVPTSYVVAGPGKDAVFDPAPMQDITTWAANDATSVLFIYGERDPWTAGAYVADPMHDVHRLTVAGGNHGSNIAGLSPGDRAFAYERLEAWTGVTPTARPLPPELPLRERIGTRQ